MAQEALPSADSWVVATAGCDAQVRHDDTIDLEFASPVTPHMLKVVRASGHDKGAKGAKDAKGKGKTGDKAKGGKKKKKS